MKSYLTPRSLTQRGLLHHILPLFFVVLFAVVGVGYLVYTHAATNPELKSAGLSGTCVDVVGGTSPNAKVALSTCNGSATQKVSVSGSGSTIRLLFAASTGSHCLEPKAGAKAIGTYVISNSVATCTTYAKSKTEYWKAVSGGYENVGANLCLTATAGSPSTGLRLQKCAATTLQKFTVATYSSSTGGGGTGSAAYCKTGGSQLWSNLANCGWPDASNTGPQTAQCPSGLAANSGSQTRTIKVSAANTVIKCENITGRLEIAAAGVTIENSTISGSSGKTGTAANGTGVIFVDDGASATVNHVTIKGNNGVHACIWDQGKSLNVTAVNCSGIDDGIFSWADTGFSQTTGDNFTIKDSYFHDFTTATANGHEDGYQTEGANNGTISHNTYQMTTAADSAIAVWDSLKSSSSITVSNNLITGGGFAVYAEDYSPSEANPVGGFTETKMTFTNNDFSTYASSCVGQYGVWFTRSNLAYKGGPTDGWHRSGNKVLETGENIDSGNPHNKGTLCS